ncbi:NAD-dependent epimerase/dehydratase family protein [Bradyrhizobium sp. U87765 SZCCT0131]|uniref:NAD-dependent epimerase/dehydratase family protein n=1 Tax=unclassified Bradyrhizobium TaxID=2631580 RepID=UPI001BA66A71|nr:MULTISPECIES: NAD-dependent epimerase/dehydratase family protein [unclassified Bradyrhizobium]MBR1222922.1 NAD-dependent epimerase/dehydratase family protein [Bradyrhizobium sp. U87765 SZCCT0131]MBR1262658.1 NAD-dependent epimerase/dehydratase family protein [Bradyrhizobium sp. U87765 SZCCT0134]MBR1308870.1 NAD-dependent epimerase/dehydratase family protein [Bradyrhizobium sp. U87765 SZCCT0110]MBR1318440.1 NAD-dependent epimerase/dehydratase family protein [Bradyrhizobium sp. U87765 SZCCT010
MTSLDTTSASPSRPRIALVIGATGGIGGETAAALVRHGWTVRGLSRRPQPAHPDITWVVGDAMVAEDVRRAAEGVALIVHAANPPGYRDWDRVVLPMIDNTIAAATAAGARIVLPGTIYNFGPDAFPSLREPSPQRPMTRKGAIRVALERRLAAAAQAGTGVLIVRAGDYFGPSTTDNSMFSAAMIQRGAPVRRILEVTARGTSHAWAYLPDVAETIAMLMDRAETLAPFEVFHFAGYQLVAGEMAASIARAVGAPRPRVWPFPWPLVVALQPFVRLFREMSEMRYLWRTSIALDDSKLRGVLGAAMPLTPLDEAVRASLKGLGCLPAR